MLRFVSFSSSTIVFLTRSCYEHSLVFFFSHYLYVSFSVLVRVPLTRLCYGYSLVFPFSYYLYVSFSVLVRALLFSLFKPDVSVLSTLS